MAHRARKLRAGLAQEGGSVTGAIYEAGYGSGSRFYERGAQTLGMTPTRYRSGGKGPRSVLRSDKAALARFWWRKARRASARSRSATIPRC
ncbi:hypothetical protein QWZ10_04155 [Paracoccus cavernae]|uniref:HTH araC/xylS-type domain-containing protein n=1 Tax=Paracoccus cavernae TaxID=1571207 RepID=A0ABT8D349_9RHOB|nr:hypothetical protein [Paracoccus cavernae]